MNRQKLESISKEIRNLLEKKKEEIELKFIEENHQYFMKDIDGSIKSNFPSVSAIIKQFHEPFDSRGMSLRISKGDTVAASLLEEQWRQAGEYSTNMGSRVHFELEIETISRYGEYKEVRKPLFNINEEQKIKSDNMIIAGKQFIDLMHKRGSVLLDTEIILGDPEEQITGQPDTCWLMMNKEKTDFGFVITDFKTNQPKNFDVHHYTKKLYPPFSNYHDNALGHYYLQIPLYARLLLKMLKGTKYENNNFLGGVIVLLKEDATFTEYKIPANITNIVLNMDLTKYINRN